MNHALIDWIVAQRRDGTLGPSSLDDLCRRASEAIGSPVSVDDYIAARQDRLCCAVLGGMVGKVVSAESGDSLLLAADRRRGGSVGPRQRRKRGETPSSAEEIEERRELVRSVLAVASKIHRADLSQRSPSPRSPVAMARDLALQSLALLLPDETDHGVGRLLEEVSGGSVAAWTKLMRRRRNPQLRAAERIAAAHVEIRGRLVRPVGMAALRLAGEEAGHG